MIFCRDVVLKERQELGNTPVFMDRWNKLMKVADSSLGVRALRGRQDP